METQERTLVSSDQDQGQAHRVVAEFLRRAKNGQDRWKAETGLWGDGLGIDSLEAAELSAMLEDEFGSDPCWAGTSCRPPWLKSSASTTSRCER
jgi:acyl carrier protein